jgi:hypothetical protein
MKTRITISVRSALLAGTVALSGGGMFAAVESSTFDRHHRSPGAQRNVAPEQEAQEQAPTPAPAKAAPSRPTPAPAPQDDSLFPPEGKPGECWTRVLVSPPSETVTDRVVLKEEGYELVEVPAVLETVDESVMVRAASERQEVIPATYKDVEERILKSPAYTRQIPVPAVYGTTSERVMVKPERSYWKKGTGSMQKIDGETGEIMCYVTEPAVYDTVTRTVLKTQATVREEQVPAVYETVKRTVVDRPAQIVKTPVAAEYKTLKVQKVKTPARTERRVIPAEYGTVSRQVARGASRMEWRRILCETNVTPEVIAEVQTKLNERGFPVGTVDGTYGKTTAKAVGDYQAGNGLAQGGLTYETLKSLGVSLSR